MHRENEQQPLILATMETKKKLIPSQEIINEYLVHHTAFMESTTCDTESTYHLSMMEALNEKYDFFDQEFVEDGLTGLKDATGQVRIPAMYKAIGARYRIEAWRNHPVPVVNAEGKYALVCADGTGTPLCEFVYDYIDLMTWTDLFIAYLEDKVILLRPDGSKLFNDPVDYVYDPHNSIIMIENEGKFGLCTCSGDYVAPIYDEMNCDENEDVYVRLGDQYGYIGYDGTFMAEPLSDEDYHKGHYNFWPNI